MTTVSGTRRVTVLLIGSSFFAAQLCFWLLPRLFEPWDAQLTDQLFRLRSVSERLRPRYDRTIVHVDLTDNSLQRLDIPYVNRGHYARLVRNLTELQVAVQLHDLIFAARTGNGADRELIGATAQAGNVYFGLAFAFSPPGAVPRPRSVPAEVRYLAQTRWQVAVEGDSGDFYVAVHRLLTFPELAAAARGLGFLNLMADRDGVFRRVPLLVRYGDAFYPSLPFRVICDYLGVPPERIRIKPGERITLQGAHRPGATQAHDIVIPIDRDGNMVINYLGPWEQMTHYNFADVFSAAEDADALGLWQEELSGKIVVVSEITTGASDIGPVPTDADFPLSGPHANVMNTILTESFLRESSAREMLLIEGILLLIVLTLSLRCSSLSLSLGSLAVALGYIASAAVLFLYGHLIVDILRPLLMVGFALFAVIAYRYVHEEKEKAFLRRTFEAYFPPSVIGKLMANPAMITAVGEKKTLTIMFTDIDGFTAHCAKMPPDRIQALLNEYFEAMVEIVFQQGGTVDKFIGDGLMAFFGDPEPQPDHALRCIRAAVEMQRQVRRIRAEWQRRGDMPIQIRIGINTGLVSVGNMGSARRLSYTVLGAPVNLAQRLEANAPVGGILISQHTHELVKGKIIARSLGKIRVKGLAEFVEVYEVPVDGQFPTAAATGIPSGVDVQP